MKKHMTVYDSHDKHKKNYVSHEKRNSLVSWKINSKSMFFMQKKMAIYMFLMKRHMTAYVSHDKTKKTS